MAIPVNQVESIGLKAYQMFSDLFLHRRIKKSHQTVCQSCQVVFNNDFLVLRRFEEKERLDDGRNDFLIKLLLPHIMRDIVKGNDGVTLESLNLAQGCQCARTLFINGDGMICVVQAWRPILVQWAAKP